MDNRPVAAALSILGAMAVVGFIDSFVVIIAAEAGLWQFHLVRSLMSLPLILAVVTLGFGRIRPVSWAGVVGRSATLTLSMMLYFASLGVLPIAQVVAGLFTSPIFVLLLSALVLRQRIGPVRIAAAASGFLGVLLILKPDLATLSFSTLMPILAGFFYAVTALATRTWCRHEHALTLVAGSFAGLALAGAAGLIVLAVAPQPVGEGANAFLLTGWVAPTAVFLFWTLVQAVGSILAVFLIVRGYQLGEASYVGIFEYSLLVFVVAWSFVLFGEVVDPVAALGIVLIVASGTVIAVRGRAAEARALAEPAR